MKAMARLAGCLLVGWRAPGGARAATVLDQPLEYRGPQGERRTSSLRG